VGRPGSADDGTRPVAFVGPGMAFSPCLTRSRPRLID